MMHADGSDMTPDEHRAFAASIERMTWPKGGEPYTNDWLLGSAASDPDRRAAAYAHLDELIEDGRIP